MSDGATAEREVLSRLLSGKKGTRLVLRRDADGLKTADVVRSAGELFVVQGRIARTGDVVLEPAPFNDLLSRRSSSSTP